MSIMKLLSLIPDRIAIRRHWPIVTLAAFASCKQIQSFLIGLSPSFIDLFLLGVLFWSLGIILSGVCLLIAIRRVFNRKPIIRYGLIWGFFTALNMVPGIFASATGAVTTLLVVGPQEVVSQSRILMESYEQDQNSDCSREYPPLAILNSYPQALQRLNPAWVRVNCDYVVVKKFGIGDVAGFVVVREGVTPVGIRLFEGIYWIDAW
jgi:hypothetical protein